MESHEEMLARLARKYGIRQDAFTGFIYDRFGPETETYAEEWAQRISAGNLFEVDEETLKILRKRRLG